MTLQIRSIIGLIDYSLLALLLIATFAGIDYAISGVLLGVSLGVLHRMFVESHVDEDEPLVTETLKVGVGIPKRRTRKAVSLKSTYAGIEPAVSNRRDAPVLIDRSVGTEDLPCHDCVVPATDKRLSRAARRRLRRRAKRESTSPLEHPIEGEPDWTPVEENWLKHDECLVPTSSTELSDDGKCPAVVDERFRDVIEDEVGTIEVIQEVSQGPPTPKGYIEVASRVSSTSASYNTGRRRVLGPFVESPPYLPPEYHYGDYYQQYPEYLLPWSPPVVMQVVPLAPQGLNTSSQFESGTGVRWLGSGELKIEMAGAWAGTEGKWRFIAINRWLEWLDASYLDTWPWGSPPLVLDMDLSRNDLTDEEFKWILLHLDRGPANVQRLRASFNQLTEKCVDALVGMLDIGNEQRVAELHLNGNSLGNRGVSAVLTAVATSSRHQHGSAVAHELPPLWLRVDDNSTDCEAELVSSIFQPGEYCMATLPASCTPDICGNGALVHLFNFGRQELPTGS